MKEKDEHCAFAILDQFGKCIATCHYFFESMGETDCLGNHHTTPVHEFEDDLQKRRI